MTQQVSVPKKLHAVFSPARGAVRFRCAYGGRGSGKSFSFAMMAAVMGYAEPLRILCTRELQTSIKESFHAELKAAIASSWWLSAHYDVGIDYLRGNNGTEFLFRGLRHNIGSIKSMAKIDICIVEEAEDVPEASWIDLEPTIRADKSEIWVIWNPRKENSPVDKRFIKSTPPRTRIAKVNWQDNPWFPKVLNEQRQYALKSMDYAQYAHIWEGEYWAASDTQVFRDKFIIEEFNTPDDAIFYYGADWGFANDPSTLIRLHIDEQERKIFIDKEAYEVGVEIDDLPSFFERVPESRKWKITADSARPETISYMNNHGFDVVGAKKGKGSVEEGVNFLKSYQIIVHPLCVHTIDELRLYSYKRDRVTNEVLPVLQDANNHIIDAARYALEQVMKYEQIEYQPMPIESGAW